MSEECSSSRVQCARVEDRLRELGFDDYLFNDEFDDRISYVKEGRWRELVEGWGKGNDITDEG